MKTKHLWLGTGIVATFTAVLFAACSKDHSSSASEVPAGKQTASLYLTDGPGYFDHVFVDIQSVQVLVDTCDKKSNGSYPQYYVKDSCKLWEDLQVKAGVYDLLTLRNGIDTLLAQGTITDGKIRQLKIKIGANNSLVKDSVTYPLLLPGNDTAATIILSLKGNEWENFGTRRCRLWLDFDVQRSIVQVRNGSFYLVPAFHWFVNATTTALRGTVLPPAARPVITIYNSTDTAYALPAHNGEFKVRGLPAGSYSVYINASNGYKDTTITQVALTTGNITSIGTIQLRK
jgi:hypothetical protein